MARGPFALVLAALLLAPGLARADDPPARPDDAVDVIVLKNGNRLEGVIVDEDPTKGPTMQVNGHRRTVKPKDIDHIEKWTPPPPPKPKPAPPPPIVETETDEPPPPPQPPERSLRDHVRIGVGVQGGIFKAKSVGPWVGLSALIDVGFQEKWSLHFDPSLDYFTRHTTINALESVDLTGPDIAITRANIENDVKGFGVTSHVQLGYDVAAPVTIRVGGIVGLTHASLTSDLCTPTSRSGLMYGPGLGIAGRVGSIEIGAQGDYVFVPIPKCDIPVSGSITPRDGVITQFKPQIVDQRVQALIVNAYVSYFFR